jgi:hypothetical protein
MNLHANAALSLKGRRELCRAVVQRERTLTQAAEAAGVSVRCARKWVGRYRAEGETGLHDRSSAPHRIPHRTSQQRVDSSIDGFRAPAGRRRGASLRGCSRWLSGAQPESDKGKIRAARELSLLGQAKNTGDLRDFSYAPGEIRTPDLRFRRPTLYPAELRALGGRF